MDREQKHTDSKFAIGFVCSYVPVTALPRSTAHLRALSIAHASNVAAWIPPSLDTHLVSDAIQVHELALVLRWREIRKRAHKDSAGAGTETGTETKTESDRGGGRSTSEESSSTSRSKRSREDNDN